MNNTLLIILFLIILVSVIVQQHLSTVEHWNSKFLNIDMNTAFYDYFYN